MRSARASTGLEGVARCALAGVKNGGRYKVNEPTAGDWEQTGAPLEGVARRRRRTPLASQTSPYLAPRFYWDYW